MFSLPLFDITYTGFNVNSITPEIIEKTSFSGFNRSDGSLINTVSIPDIVTSIISVMSLIIKQFIDYLSLEYKSIKLQEKSPIKVVDDKIIYNINELEENVFYKIEYKGDVFLIGKSKNEIIIYSVPP